jgi:hypothetical protein
MGSEEDTVKVNGKVIQGPKKVKIRDVGGGSEGNTLPPSILDALRVKAKEHRFLNIRVVLDDSGKRFLVAETSEE